MRTWTQPVLLLMPSHTSYAHTAKVYAPTHVWTDACFRVMLSLPPPTPPWQAAAQ